MSRHDGGFVSRSVDMVDDNDALGVINALQRTTELESKLRAAIQQTHPLTTSLDWDFTVADKEREALLAISEQLEYLEDKLREARFLSQNDGEQRSVLLSQLDGVRRELVEVVEIHAPRVVFVKDVVREVLAFASIGDDTPRTLAPQASEASRFGGGGRAGGGAPPASPPRRAAPRAAPRGGARSPGSALPTPPRQCAPDPPHASTVYARPYSNELWEASESPATGGAPSPAPVAPPAAGESSYRLARRPAAAPPAAAPPPRPPRSALPSEPSGASLLGGGGGGGGGGRPRRYGSASASPQVRVTDEDIYGPAPVARGAAPAAAAHAAHAGVPAGGASAGATPSESPRAYGGVLKIKDMLARAERGLSKVAEAQEQRRVPRILDDDRGSERAAVSGAAEGVAGGEDWGAPPSVRGCDDGDEAGSLWGGVAAAAAERGGAAAPAPPPSVPDWQIRAEPSQRGAPAPAPSEDGSLSSQSGLTALVGRLAGLAFVLGGVAAATMAATSKAGGGGGQQPARGGAGSRRTGRASASSKSADQPPWAAAESAARAAAARRRGAGSPPRAGRQQRGGGGEGGAQSPPVMHVRQPPASGSFPSSPAPDVSLAMG